MIDLSHIQQVYDISPLISSQLVVFPGDVPFTRKVSLSQEQGAHLDLSSIETTLHIGAHADAENHYGKNQVGIDRKDLTHYLGPCQVIEVKVERGGSISLCDFSIEAVSNPRVLFKTESFDPYKWTSHFVSISSEVIESLAQAGVILIGIDTPSVDPADSKTLDAHKVILKHNVSILEGLVLDEVSEGEYQLIALPLKIKDADASPVRAILFK